MDNSVAICVVPWNCPKWLEHFLFQVKEKTEYLPIRVFVSDNSDLESYVSTGDLPVDYQWNGGNIGYEAALNEAIRKSDSDLIVVANLDINLPKEWLTNMVNAYQSGDWAILAPRMNGNVAIQREGGKGTIETDEVPILALWLTSKSRLYNKIGLYEDMGSGEVNCDDIDMCQRVWDAGLKVGICKDVFVHHHACSVTTNQISMKDYKERTRRAMKRLEEKFGRKNLGRRIL